MAKAGMPPATIETDICVIGAGSGGLSVAAGASQMGARVVLIEKGEMGGDCLNYGCVPSKALIASAKMAHAQSHGGPFGVDERTPKVDYAAVMDHVQSVVSEIAPVDSQERFEGFGVRVIREHGRFISPREVAAGEAIISARRIVIATGSSPLVPPIEGLAEVPFLTNETLWQQRSKPDHLLILGSVFVFLYGMFVGSLETYFVLLRKAAFYSIPFLILFFVPLPFSSDIFFALFAGFFFHLSVFFHSYDIKR